MGQNDRRRKGRRSSVAGRSLPARNNAGVAAPHSYPTTACERTAFAGGRNIPWLERRKYRRAGDDGEAARVECWREAKGACCVVAAFYSPRNKRLSLRGALRTTTHLDARNGTRGAAAAQAKDAHRSAVQNSRRAGRGASRTFLGWRAVA